MARTLRLGRGRPQAVAVRASFRVLRAARARNPPAGREVQRRVTLETAPPQARKVPASRVARFEPPTAAQAWPQAPAAWPAVMVLEMRGSRQVMSEKPSPHFRHSAARQGEKVFVTAVAVASFEL